MLTSKLTLKLTISINSTLTINLTLKANSKFGNFHKHRETAVFIGQIGVLRNKNFGVQLFSYMV